MLDLDSELGHDSQTSWTHEDTKTLLSAAFYGGIVVAEWQSNEDSECFGLTAQAFKGEAEPCVIITIFHSELVDDPVLRGGVIRTKVRAGAEGLAARLGMKSLEAVAGRFSV